ncbi:hypothetical protein OAM67_01520 [bacterium]|nr:hypothetical protein [bacterium]
MHEPDVLRVVGQGSVDAYIFEQQPFEPTLTKNTLQHRPYDQNKQLQEFTTPPEAPKNADITNCSKLSSGGFGVVCKVQCRNNRLLAVKVYTDPARDDELVLLGVATQAPSRMTESVMKAVNDSGMTPATFYKASTDCKICRLCASATIPAPTRVHYHLAMPLMDGTIAHLLNDRNEPMTTFVDAIIQVLETMEHLRQRGFAYTDMKSLNILYKRLGNDEILFYLADIGSVCRIGGTIDTDKFAKQVSYLVGRTIVHAQHTPPGNSRRVFPHIATFVNPFLDIFEPVNHFDFCGANHVTNQFSVVCLMLTMLHVQPPSYKMAQNEEHVAYMRQKYDCDPMNFVNDPVNFGYGGNPRSGPMADALMKLTLRIWNYGNNWKLYESSSTSRTATRTQSRTRSQPAKSSHSKTIRPSRPSTTRSRRRTSLNLPRSTQRTDSSQANNSRQKTQKHRRATHMKNWMMSPAQTYLRDIIQQVKRIRTSYARTEEQYRSTQEQAQRQFQSDFLQRCRAHTHNNLLQVFQKFCSTSSMTPLDAWPDVTTRECVAVLKRNNIKSFVKLLGSFLSLWDVDCHDVIAASSFTSYLHKMGVSTQDAASLCCWLTGKIHYMFPDISWQSRVPSTMMIQNASLIGAPLTTDVRAFPDIPFHDRRVLIRAGYQTLYQMIGGLVLWNLNSSDARENYENVCRAFRHLHVRTYSKFLHLLLERVLMLLPNIALTLEHVKQKVKNHAFAPDATTTKIHQL